MIIIVEVVANTHRLIGASSGFIAMSAVGLPIGVCIAAGGVAWATSSLPDQLEKLIRVKHRHLTHYPLLQIVFFAGIAAAIIHFAAVPVGFLEATAGAAALGCVMHSIADSMTVEQHGIALLWPISRRGYHLMPRPLRVWVGSKSRSEWVFAACWCVLVLCYLYVRYRHQIPSLGKHA